MNIWNITLECAEWLNVQQTVMVATKTMDIEEVLSAVRDNFITGQIIEIKHIGFAHLPKAIETNEYNEIQRLRYEALSATSGTGVERVREPVAWFAKRMEAKLRENDHKGGWQDCSLDWLIERLFQEANELWRTINHPSTFEMVIYEAADVANFAMMIADIARRINAPETEKEGRTE